MSTRRFFAGVMLVAALAVRALATEGEATSLRFAAYELHLDPGATKLAAWQVEVVLPEAGASIVGIEGGTAPAYREPAYHDPEALQGGRILLASFSTGPDVASGEQHVATLHVAEPEGARPPVVRVMAAGDPGGRTLRIEARMEPSRESP